MAGSANRAVGLGLSNKSPDRDQAASRLKRIPLCGDGGHPRPPRMSHREDAMDFSTDATDRRRVAFVSSKSTCVAAICDSCQPSADQTRSDSTTTRNFLGPSPVLLTSGLRGRRMATHPPIQTAAESIRSRRQR